MTRAVIAGIHDQVFLRNLMAGSKRLPAGLVIADVFAQGPRWQYNHLLIGDTLGENALLHEAIENDYTLCGSQAKAQERLEQPGQQRRLVQPSGGNCLIRIKVHYPGKEFSSFELNE